MSRIAMTLCLIGRGLFRLLVFASVSIPTSGQTKVLSAQQLKDVIRRTRWISYAPTNYFPGESPPVLPDVKSLRADLKVLRRAGFTGLITYSAQPEEVPRIAKNLGFQALLLGIWDPTSDSEQSRALKAVRENGDLIAGLIVGNEGLLTGRYDVKTLCR